MNNIPPCQNNRYPPTASGPPLTAAASELLEKIKAINTRWTHHFQRPDRSIADKANVLTPTELNALLEALSAEIATGAIDNPLQMIKQLAPMLPAAKLQRALTVDDALGEAKAMFKEARYYLYRHENSLTSQLRAKFQKILDGAIAVLESIIGAFGIADFFKPSDSDIQADFKSHKIMTLLTLFSMLTTMLLPLLGAATGALVIGAILLSIAAVSVVWQYIKPMPNSLPGDAENWSKEIAQGAQLPGGRKASLDQIAAIMQMGRHALLVGPSRTGKSLTAKAFAQAIERGEYPELAGKKVFRINMSDLVEQKASFLGGGNNILKKISSAMGRHRENLILVFDEIHMACKDKAKICDQLKTFLDDGGAFPHLIGITTDKEYEQHVKPNHAFALRFDVIAIKNTDKSESIKILYDTLLKDRSKPLVDGAAVDYIYEKSIRCEKKEGTALAGSQTAEKSAESAVKEEQDAAAPQPAAALKLLKRCIRRSTTPPQSKSESKIKALQNKVDAMLSHLATSINIEGDSKSRSKIEKWKGKIKALKGESSKEKSELQRLYAAKKLLDEVTTASYREALKVNSAIKSKNQSETSRALNSFTLLRHSIAKNLHAYIKEKAQEHGVKLIIDRAMVDEVLAS